MRGPPATSTTRPVPKITNITLRCPAGGTTEQANVVVYKNYPGDPPTRIYATGYSSCNVNDLRRIERGVRVLY